MTSTNNATRWGRRGAVSAALLALIAGVLAAPVPALAAPDVPTDPVISTATTTWKYLDDGSDPSRGAEPLRVWTTPGFDDSTWKSAQGSFGAKGGKLAPVGPQTPKTLLNQYLNGTAAPNVPTFFFRTSFELAAGVSDEVGSVVGDLLYDDGAVVWINGERVAGFDADRVTETSNVQYAGSGSSDPAPGHFEVAGDVLVDGSNTVAIALYQDRETSSDIFLDVPSIRLMPKTDPGVVVPTPPTRIILTPTETPTTSQSFSWLAGDVTHASGQVQLRTAAGSDIRTVDAYSAGTVNGNPKQHFSATADALSPGTAYDYRVGLEGAWSEWHEFTTADPNDTDFQFVYYGDAQIGLDSTWPSVVKQAEATAPDSIGSVHAGDLINTGSNETEWLNWFKGMETSAATTNVMAAPGNHEYSGDKLLKSWKANFEYPHNNPTTATTGDLADLAVGDTDVAKQYAAYFEHWTQFAAETVYFTDYQDVRFITLNATRDTTFLTPDGLPGCIGTDCPSTKVSELWTQFQAAWLDYVLEASPSKWNVVTFHQPVYSASEGRNEPVLRQYWVPIFEKHNIDLVMMGHDHTYARGYNNDDRTETPGITDGPVYIVSNSGAKHYELETDEKNVWTNNNATQVLRGAGVTTYQVVDVSADTLVYRSYLAEKQPNATTDLPVGAVYDEFTVTKKDDGRKWVTEAGVTPPVEPEGPGTEPEPIDPSELTEANRGDVTVPSNVTVGVPFTVGLGEGGAGAKVWAWLHSDPTLLGAATANASGDFTTVVPTGTAPGEHRLVVQAADGSLIGWASVRVNAAAAAGGAAEAGLASTGAEASAALWAAGVLLALGGLVTAIAIRRRKRSSGPVSLG